MKKRGFLSVFLFAVILISIIYSLTLRELRTNSYVICDISRNWTITSDKGIFLDDFRYTSSPITGKNKYITVSKSFTIPKKYLDKPLTLKLDMVSSSYKLYINGAFVGKSGDFPPKFFNGINNINYYVLPSKLLNYDSINLIELKYYSSYESGFKGVPSILSYEYGEKLYNVQRFFNYTYYIVLSSLLFCISIVFAYIYKKYANQKYMRYFSYISLFLAIYYQNFTLSYTSLNYLDFQKIIYSCLYMAFAIVPMFLRSYFNIKDNRFDKVIIPSQFVVIIASLFVMSLNTYMNFTKKYFLVLILYECYYIFICVRAYRENKSIYSLKFMILFLLTIFLGLFTNEFIDVGVINKLAEIIPISVSSIVTLIIAFIVTLSLGDRLVELQNEILNKSKRISNTNLVLEKIINDNKELYSKTIRDNLTGLYNRFYLMEYYTNQLSFLSDTSKMALIFIDIDNFRDYNNNYGHAAGDYIIKIFSSEVLKLIKEDEVFSRFGGDEFCILTCYKNGDRPLELCESIKEVLNKNNYSYEKEIIKITCSMGVSLIEDYISFDEAVENADKAMYNVKKNGKNNFYFHKIQSDLGNI